MKQLKWSGRWLGAEEKDTFVFSNGKLNAERRWMFIRLWKANINPFLNSGVHIWGYNFNSKGRKKKKKRSLDGAVKKEVKRKVFCTHSVITWQAIKACCYSSNSATSHSHDFHLLGLSFLLYRIGNRISWTWECFLIQKDFFKFCNTKNYKYSSVTCYSPNLVSTGNVKISGKCLYMFGVAGDIIIIKRKLVSPNKTQT